MVAGSISRDPCRAVLPLNEIINAYSRRANSIIIYASPTATAGQELGEGGGGAQIPAVHGSGRRQKRPYSPTAHLALNVTEPRVLFARPRRIASSVNTRRESDRHIYAINVRRECGTEV